MKKIVKALLTVVLLSLAINVKAQLPTSGAWAVQTISADQTVYLTGDVEVQGQIDIAAGVTLTINIADSVTGDVTIKRKAGVNCTMFYSWGNVTINGISDSRRVVIDGNHTNNAQGIVLFGRQNGSNISLNYVEVKDNYKNETSVPVGSIVWMGTSSGVSSGFSMTNSLVHDCYYAGNQNGGLFCFCSSQSSNTNTYSATFDKCIFRDNKVTGSSGNVGGVIYCQENNSIVGSVSNCTFTNNSNKNGRGGTIYWRSIYPGITVSNSEFTSNSAYNGGAICTYGNMDITSCSFETNTATYQGGAIFSLERAGITMTSCSFSKNTAQFEGGALYCFRSCSINDCDFTENSSSRGGALFFYTQGLAEINIKGGSTFLKNKAVPSSYASETQGGAIWLQKSNGNNCIFTVSENCIFEGNTSSAGYGGALYFNRSDGSNICSATFNNITVTNNSSKLDGGAFYFSGGNNFNTISFSNVTFTKDTTKTGNGGALAVTRYADNLTVSNCTFDSNIALAGKGGGSYIENSNIITFENTDFRNNKATTDGGGLCVFNGNQMSMTDGSYTYNTAANGGALYVRVPLTITDVTFKHNTVSGIGGAIYNTRNMSIIGTEISSNSAGNGGAIGIVNTNVANMDINSASIITGNTATTDGGAIYFSKENGNSCSLSLSKDCKVYDNTAENGRGGAVCILKKSDNNCTITIKSQIYDNTAKLAGGGLFAGGTVNYDKIQIDEAAFSNNKSLTSNGGGFAIDKYVDNLTVSNSTFLKNKAPEGNGGGAYILTSNKIYFTDNEFSTNSASANGGAVSINAGNDVKISGGNYHDNNASQNGGAFAGSTENGQLKWVISGNCKINNNTATNDGGAVYLNKNNGNSSTLTIGESEIATNTATNGNGGAIAVYRANNSNTFTLTFTGGTIKANSAVNGNGGGVYVLAGTNGNRGAVQFTGNSIIGGDSASDGNKSIDGAGMYMTYATATFSNGISKNNVATGNGGGLFSLGSYITFTENSGSFPQYIGNSAVNGGGLYLSECLGNIINHTEVKNNNASGNGGGFYINGSSENTDFNASSSGTFSVISGNTAVNGAGMYMTSLLKSYLSHAEITGNIASGNGGGLYISGGNHYFDESSSYMRITGNSAQNGAGLFFTGSAKGYVQCVLIKNNHAIGEQSISTAYKSIPTGSETIQGIGGGVYIATGTSESDRTILEFQRTDVFGIYDNTADNGATDLFADGAYTKITMPTTDMTNMTLLGTTNKASGLFEDYITNDTNYNKGTNRSSTSGRYPFVTTPVAYSFVNVNDLYVSLTIGNGNSIIVKVAGLHKGENAVFTLIKDGESTPYDVFALTGTSENGETTVSRVIKHIEIGSWTVKETGWSWSYNAVPETREITKDVTGGSSAVEFNFNFTKTSSIKSSEAKATNEFDSNSFRVSISINPRGLENGGTIGL